MARSNRSRFEVFPVDGGFRLQEFDKFGREVKSPDKIFGRRNNCRRECIRISRAKGITIPIQNVPQKFTRVLKRQRQAEQPEAQVEA
jgi:hypothetical protein